MSAEYPSSDFQILAAADHDRYLQLLEDGNTIDFFLEITKLFVELNALPENSTMRIAYTTAFSDLAQSLQRNAKDLKIAKKLLTQISLLYP